MWSVCRWLRKWWLFFFLLEVDVTLGGKCLQGCSRTIWFSFLVLLKEMRTRSQFKILSFCFWCKSEICLRNHSGGKLLLKPFSSYNKLLDRILFRFLSNIHDGVLPRKQPTAKSLAADIDKILRPLEEELHREYFTGF